MYASASAISTATSTVARPVSRRGCGAAVRRALLVAAAVPARRAAGRVALRGVLAARAVPTAVGSRAVDLADPRPVEPRAALPVGRREGP
ncbi:hypothetical protein GCM10009687_45770 [Asanoa iriomotensis]|uniref:Uncharacterized protein n=1 Tax=Asanoa iriomotensis TaxID=234613 RepID=A0ABQ4BVC1_9ACTN|nr:hypothetical protein Air01nite_05790 [Asanoa iriomotensis]